MRKMNCQRCGQRVFFENTRCARCEAVLGFVPEEMAMASFELGAQDGAWQRLGDEGQPAQRPCANYREEGVCNWMLPAASDQALCLCCRCNEVIPSLDKPGNRRHWAAIEQAKHRLFYGLLALKLPVVGRGQDPEQGLAFRFLEETEAEEPVLTGHADGVITLNIAEADDARREQVRSAMHEPYRTLLGHFRHEIGHYYWDRLIRNSRDSAWLDEFRTLFGDERSDYAQALQTHYATPVLDWPERFVSAYASSHPWEDWAECWAHYLHIQDGLETAHAWGLRLERAVPDTPPIEPQPVDLGTLLAAPLIEQWLPVSQFINAMDRSLGTHDSYPFTLPPPVVGKIEFIHKVVAASSVCSA